MSEPGHGLEFNVGVDVEEGGRFLKLLLDDSVHALFFAEELQHCRDRSDTAVRLAGTWSAKEATVKALWPWIRLEPRRVRVLRDVDGRPFVQVVDWDPGAAGVVVRVSISHTRNVAVASAVAWGSSPGVDAADVNG